jgi:hypothetical protein
MIGGMEIRNQLQPGLFSSLFSLTQYDGMRPRVGAQRRSRRARRAARVRPDTGEATAKQRYRVTNWSEYDRSLFNRGKLTIRFDDASINRDYHRRSIAENMNMIYRLKQLGDSLYSRTFERQVTEGHVRLAIISTFTNRGKLRLRHEAGWG